MKIIIGLIYTSLLGIFLLILYLNKKECIPILGLSIVFLLLFFGIVIFLILNPNDIKLKNEKESLITEYNLLLQEKNKTSNYEFYLSLKSYKKKFKDHNSEVWFRTVGKNNLKIDESIILDLDNRLKKMEDK